MLTDRFNFHHGISYWCSIVTICLKCTIFALGAWDRQRDRRITASLNAPYTVHLRCRKAHKNNTTWQWWLRWKKVNPVVYVVTGGGLVSASVLVSINATALQQAELLLEWMTTHRFQSHSYHFHTIMVLNQPSRSSQLGHPSGVGKMSKQVHHVMH